MVAYEDRICEVCGEPVFAGMTNKDGDFYCHEECFEKFMNEIYGKHRWMMVQDDGNDGYYLVSNDRVVGGYCGTGIYYTDWSADQNEGEQGYVG